METDILAPQSVPYSMEHTDVGVADGLFAVAGGARSGELKCLVSEPAGTEGLDNGCGVICWIDQQEEQWRSIFGFTGKVSFSRLKMILTRCNPAVEMAFRYGDAIACDDGNNAIIKPVGDEAGADQLLQSTEF